MCSLLVDFILFALASFSFSKLFFVLFCLFVIKRLKENFTGPDKVDYFVSTWF